MKIFFDTEFLDLGDRAELVSLGAVNENGEEFYAENADCDLTKANNWVLANVVPHFTGPLHSAASIAHQFKAFCGPRPEFWAYYGTYDWWLVHQLYGGFMNLPAHWPKWFNEIQTAALIKGAHAFPLQTSTKHHALNDAKWNKQVYEYIFKPEY